MKKLLTCCSINYVDGVYLPFLNLNEDIERTEYSSTHSYILTKESSFLFALNFIESQKELVFFWFWNTFWKKRIIKLGFCILLEVFEMSSERLCRIVKVYAGLRLNEHWWLSLFCRPLYTKWSGCCLTFFGVDATTSWVQIHNYHFCRRTILIKDGICQLFTI